MIYYHERHENPRNLRLASLGFQMNRKLILKKSVEKITDPDQSTFDSFSLPTGFRVVSYFSW